MIAPHKSKKKAPLTTKEIAKRVFPKQVIDQLKQVTDSKPKTRKKATP